jgi:hypothetical protein
MSLLRISQEAVELRKNGAAGSALSKSKVSRNNNKEYATDGKYSDVKSLRSLELERILESTEENVQFKTNDRASD